MNNFINDLKAEVKKEFKDIIKQTIVQVLKTFAIKFIQVVLLKNIFKKMMEIAQKHGWEMELDPAKYGLA